MAIPDYMQTPDENSNRKYLPPPDLVPRKDGIRRDSLEKRSTHNVDRGSVSSKDDNEDKPAKKSKTPPDGRPGRWTWKRKLCCLGWILCFPICCAGYALRERPVDEDDMRDDDCLPCYGPRTV